VDPPERVILHADLDAFYASVEQLDHPELRGLPVVVGGLGGRGVVTTASYEARPFGVHSAMPMAEARRLCPHAVFLPGRMERYAQASRQVFAVFREFTPEVEALSLDEAFLDVTHGLRLFGGAAEIARRLRRRVREATGLAVSVGIAATKMVAKIASSRAKPDGVLEVVAGTEAAFLAPLPVRELWGVGPVAAATLDRAGIRTIGDLAALDDERGRALGGGFLGLRALARGEDPRVVEPDRERKSYGEENTFSADHADGERAWLAGSAPTAAARAPWSSR
jgi:DNA polymerase IV